MMTPSSTTRPIASAHVIWLAIEYATNALRPSPVASASGKLATAPIRMRHHAGDERRAGRDRANASACEPPPR